MLVKFPVLARSTSLIAADHNRFRRIDGRSGGGRHTNTLVFLIHKSFMVLARNAKKHLKKLCMNKGLNPSLSSVRSDNGCRTKRVTFAPNVRVNYALI